jgi:hypothetical protein
MMVVYYGSLAIAASILMGTRDPEETVTRLIRTLDRPEISRAIERLERGLHVVK